MTLLSCNATGAILISPYIKAGAGRGICILEPSDSTDTHGEGDIHICDVSKGGVELWTVASGDIYRKSAHRIILNTASLLRYS